MSSDGVPGLGVIVTGKGRAFAGDVGRAAAKLPGNAINDINNTLKGFWLKLFRNVSQKVVAFYIALLASQKLLDLRITLIVGTQL